MKKIVISLAVMASVLGMTSCKDFLTEEVYDFYSPENMYRTASDAIVAITGVYAPMSQPGFMGSEFFQLIDLDGDHGCAEGWIINNGFADGNWQNTNSKFKNAWEQLYIMIERANVVIEKVPGINMDQALKDQVVGEAYFLRSMCYFYLVRLWGAVPAHAGMLRSDVFDYAAPRQPIQTIYDDFIIPGLKIAEEKMVYKNHSLALPVGRANKAAAKALLARVYLYIASASKTGANIWVKVGQQPGTSGSDISTSSVTNVIQQFTKATKMAGYENYDSDAYFKLAMEKAGELVAIEGTSQGYSLHPDFMDAFKDINKDKTENIFNLCASGLNKGTLYDYQQFMGYKGDQVQASGFGRGYMLVGNSFYLSYMEEYYGAKYCMQDGVKTEVLPAGKSDAGLQYYDIPSPNRHLRDERVEKGFKHTYSRLSSSTKLPDYWFFPQNEKNYWTLAECGSSDPFNAKNYQKSDNDTGCTTKYDSYTSVTGNRYTDATVSLIRYADVLLMYAEALNEVYGPTYVDPMGNNAIYYVNKVRTRSKAVPIPADGNGGCYGESEDDTSYPLLSTQEGFRSFVLEERGRELYYEMNRVFDLKRWGIYLDVMNKLNNVRAMSKRREAKHLFFPIPIEEIRANTALSADDNNGW